MQTDNTTGIQSESKEIPTEFNLSQNYPNPFNPSTKIEVKIAKAGYFRLAVYDMTGQLVGTLIDEHLEAGVYSPRFEAGELPSGIYIYKLAGENVNFSKKMVLIK
ncbi:MAG: T9SS type A sorting domain-containing protein [Ignavibacteriaceae bacterium]|nr:T9SS type A sorting domain-containing protein [Ignavibacteriaceae bacterium]